MSGQATGWVLRHGPKDRAMRAVLVTIADAANRDGEHATPGIAAMCEGSLYGKSHVSRIAKRLLDEGWVEIEEQGNGRGKATVYRVVMGRETPPSVGGSNQKPPHLLEETPPSDGSVPLIPTKEPNGPVEHVFTAWITSTKRTARTVLDSKRRSLITAALKSHSLEDVLDAVRGWENSPYHRGENPSATVYNDLGLLLRDAEHIERFRDLARGPTRAPAKTNGQAPETHFTHMESEEAWLAHRETSKW